MADMIYLKNKTGEQQVRIPWNGLADGGSDTWPTLKIWSTTDARTAYDVGWEGCEVEDALYTIGTVKLPKGLPDGEYEYRFSYDGNVLSSGVCQIGDYKAVPVQKGNTDITFKQYGGRN